MDQVRVVQYDEVHSRIECDPGVAHEIRDHFTFEVPGYKFMPAAKFGWDGRIRLFNAMTCLLYKGLISQLEDFCRARDYSCELDEALRLTDEFTDSQYDELVARVKPKHTPRDYQKAAIMACIRSKRKLLLSPTSSGKSLVIYLLCRHYEKKTLIIVPTVSLVSQMSSDFADYGYEPRVHKIKSGAEKNTSDLFTVTTWQSAVKQPQAWFDQFEVVIGDEAHLFKAKSLSKIMSSLKDCEYKFGFTGTLDGTETHKMVLEGLFGPVEQVITTRELIDKGHAAEFNIKAIVLRHPPESVKAVAGRSYADEMDFIVRDQARNEFIVNLALGLKGNTLLFFFYVDKHGKVLRDMLQERANGRSIHFIAGEVDGDDREEIRRIVETEEDAIIVASSGTTSTGTNIINLRNIIFASPSKARIRNLQSIGRSLRKAGGKTHATLYDVADDFTGKTKKKNHTLLHFIERIKIYIQEQFPYKIYQVNLNH